MLRALEPKGHEGHKREVVESPCDMIHDCCRQDDLLVA